MSKYIDCRLFRNGTATPVSLADVGAHIGEADAFLWIELASPEPDALARLGADLALHELALEDAISAHQRPKLEEYGEHLFIAVRTARLSGEHIEFGETHIFVGKNFLVVIRHDDGEAYSPRITEKLGAARNGKKPGAAYALYLALDHIVDELRPVLAGLQRRFTTLENRLLERELERDNLERLYALKRELARLRDAAEPLQDILPNLIRLHPELVTKPLKAYYRDVHDHVLRVMQAIDHLRTSTSDAMQFHLGSLSLEQNASVQKLAGWGALLALPTVVFSLYGMNFEWMPELHWRFGYPALLVLTGAATLILHKHLKRRGWI
jgi:magnesium transporter